MEKTWFDELTKTPLGALSVVVTHTGVWRIVFGRARDLPFEQADGSPPSSLYQALRLTGYPTSWSAISTNLTGYCTSGREYIRRIEANLKP